MNENFPLIFLILVIIFLNQCSSDKHHQEVIDKLHQIELKLDK